MATEKMRPCCAKIHAMISTERAELARLARMAARQEARGRRIDGYLRQMEKCRLNLTHYDQQKVEHEAEHAGAIAVPA